MFAVMLLQIETMSGWSNEGLKCMMDRNGCKKVND
jgi:hypothetical protein